MIDVGAAGKGYLVDLVAGILRAAGGTGFVVDGSGDLRHAGEHAIQVGLEHPHDPRLEPAGRRVVRVRGHPARLG